MICVSLGKISLDEALKICREVKLVEIRADLMLWPKEYYKKVIATGVKTIFTCRPGPVNEEDRLNLYRFAAECGAKYIDIELESGIQFREKVLRIINQNPAELIISYHNYEHTPDYEDLVSILEDCYFKAADVAKIACRVYTHSDSARLMSLYEKSGRKVIVGMGNTGKITRIAAGLMGAEFTFASSGSGNETAEGQINYRDMSEIYKLLNIEGA
jgi:3-dehydroquinate dehydratase-1